MSSACIVAAAWSVRSFHCDPVVKPGKLVEPPCGLTVFPGEIHGDHVAAAASGDVTGGSADTAARVEDLVVGGDLNQVGQLGGGDAAHRVEVLKQSEVRGPKVAGVFPGGGERLLDAPRPGGAGGQGERSALRSEHGITGLGASAAWPCPGRRDP